MGRRIAITLLLSACSFHPPGASGDDTTKIDAREDPQSGDGFDAPAGCTPGFLDLCAQAPATDPFTVTGVESFDTDQDPRCRTLDQGTGPDVCLVMATSVDITGTLQVSGSRPLAIASSTTFSISGELDVSSRRDGRTGPGAEDASCTMTRLPEPDLGGGGGAAGGSVAGTGGDGGIGDQDASLGNDGVALNGTAGTPMSALAYLRGGCGGAAGGSEVAGGAGGDGGHGGGGLYATAREAMTITSTGRIRATGAGGTGGPVQAGGGGGGAGGVVVLEAPTITIDGELSANGGGGGEGGARVGTTPVSGVSGTDGDYGTTAANGGAGSDTRFGFGGAGAVGTTGAIGGTSSVVAGGGGGGSVGAIRLLGTRQGSGLVTPAEP